MEQLYHDLEKKLRFAFEGLLGREILADYIPVAIYWYAALNYNGQNDPLYRIVCNSTYRQSIIGTYESEDTIVRMMVAELSE